MNKYSQEGISCTINYQKRLIKLHSLCCCVDSVSPAAMQSIVQFNGFYGCSWCLHRGGRGHALKYTIPDVHTIIEPRIERNTVFYIAEALQ